MDFLLLRGLSREQRHWGAFPVLLGAALPGARVLCLDLPGTGTEYARATPTDVPSIVADLRRRWRALPDAAAREWCLFGMSLGGMVAMEWCHEHPEDFARLVLCNTSAADLNAPWERLSLRVLPSMLRALAARNGLRRERLVLSMTSRKRSDLDAIAREWATYQEDHPVRRTTVVRQLWAASRYHGPAKLAVPALLLAGGHDPLVAPACQERLAAHLGIPIARHPDAGHDLPLDDAGWVVRTIAEWLVRPGEAAPLESCA